MPVSPWHPRGNAYAIVWSVRNGSHGHPYALIVWRGPGRFEVRMSGVVREFATGDEAAVWAWEENLRQHRSGNSRGDYPSHGSR